MSAITGIFYRDGRTVEEEQIKKMTNRLSHRGPDGSAIWYEGSVALGHQMLHTTPESLHEKLPYEEDSLVITADARIDNRKELSEKLKIEDKEEIADSYFILKAYQKWGEKCPEELLGDFAFAIWDKNKEKLFCARDHMGVKPFYYYLSDDVFYFGTEIKAILILHDIPIELNERKLALFLLKDTTDKEFTFYRDIKGLVSAHSLYLDYNKNKCSRYWKLDPNLSIIMDSEEDYVNSFLEIFTEAIRCRLRSHYPIGFELSGGLDSSSVLCLAKEIINDNENKLKSVNSFSLIYDKTPESDEREYINKIVNTDGVDSHLIKGDEISPLKNINDIFSQQDEPFIGPHMTKQIKFYEKIREKGIRLLFTGEGGDQIISHGNNYLRELAINFKWINLIKEINGRSSNLNESRIRIILNRIIIPTIPYFFKKWVKLLQSKNNIINEDFLKSLTIDKNMYDMHIDKLNKLTSKERHYYTINYALHELLFGIIDRSTANFNIEMRYPFYDKRLIEFAYALPSKMKLKHGWSRYILRIAMQNILPQEIQWRVGKTDLSPTYKQDLLSEEKTIKKMITEEDQIIEKYVNIQKLRKIFKKYKLDNLKDPFDIWLIIQLYAWLKFTDINNKNN